MKIMFFALLLISMIIVVSFASPVPVTTVTSQINYGTLTYVYYETISGPAGSTPNTNTALIPTSSSGSYSIAQASTAYLWSPQFGSATTISAGNWVLELWATAASNISFPVNAIQVSIYVTDSSGNIQSIVASNIQSPTVGSSVAQYIMSFAGSQVTVPQNGYITISLLATQTAFYTVYWGNGQPTNFQVPYRVLT